MNSKQLFEGFFFVDDSYLDLVDAQAAQPASLSPTTRHLPLRKLLTFVAAAAIAVSILAVTAVAAGWLPNIFAAVDPVSPEEKAVFDAALQQTQPEVPEVVNVPEVDYTQFTLFQRYYDGETILLGYDLSKVMPEPIVGFQPDAALTEKLTRMAEYQHTPYPGQTNDTLEQRVQFGIITQEEYDRILSDRTEYGKKHDLHRDWQITLDHMLEEELSPEQYAQFWNLLETNGSCCVALPSTPYVGDHIYINGHDCGEVLGEDCWSFRTDYTTDQGDCILLNPLPDESKGLSSVDVEISLRSGWNYWYMELEGDVYSCYEANTPYQTTFTIECSSN